MRATVDLPDSIYAKVEMTARAQGLTVEELIVKMFEREVAAAPKVSANRSTVKLPLVKSKQPGTLDLETFDFDDLLA